jgi:DNA helicase-2/ATP-dependent DNA helicase PcrA
MIIKRVHMSQPTNVSPNGITYSIDYQQALNPAQLEAVTFSQGPLLVIAGAGSGKTRTLTYRVARLVEDGVAPSTILLLTFTRKASQELHAQGIPGDAATGC